MEQIKKIDRILLALEARSATIQYDIDSDVKYQQLCELVTKFDWDGYLAWEEKEICWKNLKELVQKIYPTFSEPETLIMLF